MGLQILLDPLEKDLRHLEGQRPVASADGGGRSGKVCGQYLLQILAQRQPKGLLLCPHLVVQLLWDLAA